MSGIRVLLRVPTQSGGFAGMHADLLEFRAGGAGAGSARAGGGTAAPAGAGGAVGKFLMELKGPGGKPGGAGAPSARDVGTAWFRTTAGLVMPEVEATVVRGGRGPDGGLSEGARLRLRIRSAAPVRGRVLARGDIVWHAPAKGTRA